MALSRSREFEADRSGARLIGDGEPLARALAKLEAGAKRIPMQNVRPETAQMYIINPLVNPATGKQFQFRSLFMSHPSTEERIARLRSKEWAR
jgi:heat shock protein HtpX